MATNPSIILSGNNFNDLLTDQRAKLAQAQASQQAAQLQDLQVAQAKQAFDDDKNFRAAYLQANGDPNLTVKIAAKLGVSPTKIQGFQKTQSDMLTQLLAQRKTQAETDETKLKADDLKHSQITGALQSVLAAKPEEFETAKAFTIDKLQKDGIISDTDAAAARKMDPSHLKLYSAQMMNVQQLKEQAEGQAATSNAASAAKQADVAEAKHVDEHAKTITEQQEKARADTANKLMDGYNAGPAGYLKAYQALDPQVLKDNQIPTPQQIAAMPPAQAATVLNSMGMSGNERTQAAQRQQEMQQTAAHQAVMEQNAARATSIAEKHLSLDWAKTQAGFLKDGLDANGKPMPDAAADLLKTTAQNTSDGKLYIDQDAAFKGLPKGQQMQLRQAASASNIPLLTGKEASQVKSLDAARNQILGVFGTYLDRAEQHGTMLTRGVANTFNTVTQSDPALASASKDFLTTIEALKAAGGAGSGLRITGKEIDKMYAMRPTMYDTPDTIKSKLGRIQGLMNDQMNAARHDVPVTNKPAAPGTGAPEKVATMDHLKSYAASKGISIEQAASDARKDGYKVQ